MSTDQRPIRPGPAWARTGFLIVLVGVWLGARARMFVRPPLGTAGG
jgi:hypothetical protein